MKIVLQKMFDMYYISLLEIKDFNALPLTDNKPLTKSKRHMKNLLKCQEIIAMQKEIY